MKVIDGKGKKKPFKKKPTAADYMDDIGVMSVEETPPKAEKKPPKATQPKKKGLGLVPNPLK